MIKSNFIEATVLENKHWTDALYSLRVESEKLPFTAGQFGRLALKVDGAQVARPYSFVNPPDDPVLEFYSIVVADGHLSSRLASLDVGSPIWIANTGTGFLVLDEVPESSHLWLLSTGTGLGPFLSILRTATPWSRFKKIILVHAVRTSAELSYRDVISDISLQHPGQFISIPFVSREQTDFALPGRITVAIENGSLEARAECPFSATDSQVMLCGNPAMIKDVSSVLLELGLTKNRRRTPGNITVESYW